MIFLDQWESVAKILRRKRRFHSSIITKKCNKFFDVFFASCLLHRKSKRKLSQRNQANKAWKEKFQRNLPGVLDVKFSVKMNKVNFPHRTGKALNSIEGSIGHATKWKWTLPFQWSALRKIYFLYFIKINTTRKEEAKKNYKLFFAFNLLLT